MRFFECHFNDGAKVYVNVDQVDTIFETEKGETGIITSGRLNALTVKETVSEVLELMEATLKEKVYDSYPLAIVSKNPKKSLDFDNCNDAYDDILEER